MGHTWSSRRRNNRHNHQTPPLSHPPSLNLSPPPPRPPPPPPHPLTPPPPQPPSYAFAANAPYPAHPQNPYPILPCHPPHLSNSRYYSRPPLTPQSYFHPYFNNQSNGFRPPPPPLPPPPPPPLYVDHHSTKKIKNDVNVRKDSIRIEVDENNPEYHLVSFTFDAMVDGSITIFYFGKEGANCTFTPLYPEIHVPVRISFQKGLGQKFCQPTGTGIDLGFFDINDLSNPLSGDVFPLVISAESNLPSSAMNNQLDDSVVTTAPHAQITQAVLEKNDENHFQVKVIKQVLWIDGDRYELREIYGISSSNESTINDDDSGKECVICMTEPKDTAVLPCRHMCMCSDCAKELRLQSNKCPVCRQPIQELMEIKVNEGQS